MHSNDTHWASDGKSNGGVHSLNSLLHSFGFTSINGYFRTGDDPGSTTLHGMFGLRLSDRLDMSAIKYII
jgi:hypothetical protein